MRIALSMILLWLLAVSTVGADIDFVPFNVLTQSEDFEHTVGVCSYSDAYGVDLTAGAYLQTAIVRWDEASLALNFGVVVPAEDPDWRTRPEFSLTYRNIFLPPKRGNWLIPEIGAYVAVGPYEAWGVQVSLMRFKWY